jgi:cytochrome c oxidase subunit 1
MAIEEARNLHVSDDHHHDGHDDHHHEPETFLTKYIFSQDHKMIAKQFLFTLSQGFLPHSLSTILSIAILLPVKNADNGNL